MTDTAESFSPVLGDAPRVLILGSMPGRRSLADAEYYAHPRNLFWPLMGELFGAHPTLPYADRLTRLTEAGVALWDVLARCERPGSLDASILAETEVPNPIGALLTAHPTIGVVATNGATAAALFRRHVLAELDPSVRARLTLLRLPSTSPANASIPLEVKRAAWRALLDARQGRLATREPS